MTLPGEKIEVVYDEDGELDWDWWMSLSEAETDAVEAQTAAEYNEWWLSLTRLEQYRVLRARSLAHILRRREILKIHPFLGDLETFKRDPRVSLLKAREFLKTGVYPISDS